MRGLSDGEEGVAEAMARAVGATAHGHAALLLDGSFNHGDDVVEIAVGRAATATMALVEGRSAFRSGDRAH